MINFVYVMFILTSTPTGLAQMPYMIYGADPSAQVACELDAKAKNKTVVQRYRFTCLKVPEIEI